MPVFVDDVGTPVDLTKVRRVVSLVPSLTETIADAAPGLLTGVTDWCTEPPGLQAKRIGGTKWPNVEAIIELRPDVVVANLEENREVDLDELRQAGIPVYVTAPATVAASFTSLRRMLAALGVAEPGWIGTAEREWAQPVDPQLAGLRTAAFIWRRPWMAVGRDTFAGDVLRRLGLTNIYADDEDRYPKVSPAEVRRIAERADLVVLPDEPYAFSVSDGPEAFAGVRTALVSGRHLTWYGPSLVEARAVLTAALISPVMHL